MVAGLDNHIRNTIEKYLRGILFLQELPCCYLKDYLELHGAVKNNKAKMQQIHPFSSAWSLIQHWDWLKNFGPFEMLMDQGSQQ